jgi:hypothetical protein
VNTFEKLAAPRMNHFLSFPSTSLLQDVDLSSYQLLGRGREGVFSSYFACLLFFGPEILTVWWALAPGYRNRAKGDFSQRRPSVAIV